MANLLPAEVNVWFLYGSFSYGLECQVLAPPDFGHLVIDLSANSPLGDTDRIADFLELMIDEAPKGLVSFHVSFFQNGSDKPLFRLSTPFVPRLQISRQTLRPQLHTEGLTGLTPEDENLWKAWQNHFE